MGGDVGGRWEKEREKTKRDDKKEKRRIGSEDGLENRGTGDKER